MGRLRTKITSSIIAALILVGSASIMAQEEYVPSAAKEDLQGLAMFIYLGYLPTIANLNPYNLSGLKEQPKPSGISLDLGVKFKYRMLYARSGIGYAAMNPLIPNSRCRLYYHCVPNESGITPVSTPKDYSVSYIKIPVLGGFNFTIPDQGAIQMGFGFIFQTGSIAYEFKNENKNLSLGASSIGWMIQLAFEKKLGSSTALSLEFNLSENLSSPTQFDEKNGKNLYKSIDYSGTEFLLGVGFYL